MACILALRNPDHSFELAVAAPTFVTLPYNVRSWRNFFTYLHSEALKCHVVSPALGNLQLFLHLSFLNKIPYFLREEDWHTFEHSCNAQKALNTSNAKKKDYFQFWIRPSVHFIVDFEEILFHLYLRSQGLV